MTVAMMERTERDLRVDEHFVDEMRVVARAVGGRDRIVAEGAVLDATSGDRPPAARAAWMLVTDRKVVLAFGSEQLGKVVTFRYDDVYHYEGGAGVLRVDWVEPHDCWSRPSCPRAVRPGRGRVRTVILESRRHADLLAEAQERCRSALCADGMVRSA